MEWAVVPRNNDLFNRKYCNWFRRLEDSILETTRNYKYQLKKLSHYLSYTLTITLRASYACALETQSTQNFPNVAATKPA